MNGTYKFTILRHKTKHEHFDLLFDFGESRMLWIIPNKIPEEVNERRLAVEEEKILDFRSQESHVVDVYGTGEAEIWDSGTIEVERKNRDKIIFRANGDKMRGRFIILVPVWGLNTKKRLWVLFKVPFPSATKKG